MSLKRLFPKRSAAYVNSEALREASLKSEARRAYMVIALLVLLAALLNVTPMSSSGRPGRWTAYGGFGLLIVIQVCVLVFIRGVRARQRGMPTWFAAVTVVMESLVPTGLIMTNI